MLVLAALTTVCRAAPEAGAIQLTSVGDSGLRSGHQLEASGSSVPLMHFSPPTHAPSLYPVTELESSEFLPSQQYYPSAARSKAGPGEQRLSSQSSNPYNVEVLTHESNSYPVGTSFSFADSHKEDHGQSYDPPVYYPEASKSSDVSNLAASSRSPRISDVDLRQKTTAVSHLDEFVKPKADSPSQPPTDGAQDQSTTAKRPLEVSSVRFQCKGRTGYFGDDDFACQVFHFCSHDGKRYTFRCGNGLAFNEMTVSCSAADVKRCSPAIFIPTDSPSSTLSTYATQKEKSLASSAESNGIQVGPEYSIATIAASNERQSFDKKQSFPPGPESLTAFAAIATSSDKSKAKNLHSNSNSKNPFFDHFETKMKSRIVGSTNRRPAAMSNHGNEVSSEYEYVDDYEYEEEPHLQNSPKVSSFHSLKTDQGQGNYQSKSFGDFSRSSRTNNPRQGPSQVRNSLNPTGFQQFSPAGIFPIHRGGPIINSTPRPIFFTTATPIYDMRTAKRIPLPSSLDHNVHTQSLDRHPIASHLSANRFRVRPTAAAFSGHPQLVSHINNIGVSGFPQAGAANFNNLQTRPFHQSSLELNPYAHALQPIRNQFPPIQSVNPSSLPLFHTGSQSFSHPLSPHEVRHLQSTVFPNSLEIATPLITSPFHTPLENTRLFSGSTSQDLSRPIKTSSTGFNSLESPQSRPIHNSFEPALQGANGLRLHPHQSLNDAYYSVTTARPRPIDSLLLHQSQFSRIPQTAIIRSTPKPLPTPDDRINQFFEDHPLADIRTRPISNGVLNAHMSSEVNLQRPTIRFPNRDVNSEDSRFRPISSSTQSSVTDFHTTVRPQTTRSQSVTQSQDRPPSRRRPASQSLRQHQRPNSQAQIQSDRKPLTTGDFPRKNLVSSIGNDPASGNRFPTSTLSPINSHSAALNSFTTARSPLYHIQTGLNDEYEYYDEEYYDDNHESVNHNRKPQLPKSVPKPYNDYDDYYNSDDAPNKPLRSNSIVTTPRPNVPANHETNSLSTNNPISDQKPLKASGQSNLTTKQPIPRKRPPRLPARSRTRTTTPLPSHDYDYEEHGSDDSPATKTTTTVRPTTAAKSTPSRQSVRSRIPSRKRVTNTSKDDQKVNESTTVSSTENDRATTTRRPKPMAAGGAPANDRLSSLRNRLKIRAKRVKTAAEIELEDGSDPSTHNKSLDEEQTFDETNPGAPTIVVQEIPESENESTSDEPPNPENSTNVEVDDTEKKPAGRAFRKRPLDPEVRARFRKFLKNRRKKLEMTDSENKSNGKTFDKLDPITSNNHDEIREEHQSNEASRDSLAEPTNILLDSLKTPSTHGESMEPMQESYNDTFPGSTPSVDNEPISSSTEKHSNVHPPAAPAFAPTSDTTRPAYKKNNAITVSEESYSLLDESIKDENELYENQESRLISERRQRPSIQKLVNMSGNVLTLGSTKKGDENRDIHMIANTVTPEPNNRTINFSLSDAVSKTTFVSLATTPIMVSTKILTPAPISTTISTTTPISTFTTSTTMIPNKKVSIFRDEKLKKKSYVTSSSEATTAVPADDKTDLAKVMLGDSPDVKDPRPKMPHRVAKPVFNFQRKYSAASEKKHFISASDYEGSAEGISRVDLVSFTMSTDPPLLPLQKLMPFHK
ncbi:mucin-17 isoform X2 [Hyalella azteca]|uniref:Mucin-17 isoform X2 n=1 Tax=Hyalella azteca TaxID=294128 RepID=A0A8B7N5U7_HYAAZ|nr:mucin-17 isoform X2 [Hyalella azteca]